MFKELYARFKLGILFKNYKSNKILSDFLNQIMIDRKNISNIKITQYWIVVTYNNIKIKLWNENTYYGWLSHGSIGETLMYSGAMPDTYTMYKFKLFLDKYYKEDYDGN